MPFPCLKAGPCPNPWYKGPACRECLEMSRICKIYKQCHWMSLGSYCSSRTVAGSSVPNYLRGMDLDTCSAHVPHDRTSQLSHVWNFSDGSDFQAPVLLMIPTRPDTSTCAHLCSMGSLYDVIVQSWLAYLAWVAKHFSLLMFEA